MRCYTSGSQGGCFCDEVCSEFGDCCGDFSSLCMHTPDDDSPGEGECTCKYMLCVWLVVDYALFKRVVSVVVGNGFEEREECWWLAVRKAENMMRK